MPEPRALTGEELAAIRKNYAGMTAPWPEVRVIAELIAHITALEGQVAEARADQERTRTVLSELADAWMRRAEGAERQRDALRAVLGPEHGVETSNDLWEWCHSGWRVTGCAICTLLAPPRVADPEGA